MNLPDGAPVWVLIRPRGPELAADGEIAGRVADVVFRGEAFRVELENGCGIFTCPLRRVWARRCG